MPTANVDYIAELDADGVTTAARQHHALWGGGRDLEAHVAAVHAQLARAGSRMRYVAVRDEGGEIVSSLKRYRLRLAWGEDDVNAIGIGAVYTPEAQRGRGYARVLIERLLDEARGEGVRGALLFSDIDTAYYERLGFETLSHVSWSAKVEALPQGTSLFSGVCDDETVASDWFEHSWTRDWIRAKRDADSWSYWAWHNRVGVPRLLVRANEPFGYVCCRSQEGTLWVDDVATLELEPAALWASMRALAEHEGAERVGGWLRPEHAGGPFVAAARSRCIPMVAKLHDTLAPVSELRGHFSSLDHF